MEIIERLKAMKASEENKELVSNIENSLLVITKCLDEYG